MTATAFQPMFDVFAPTPDRVEAATYRARHDAGLSLMGLEGDAS